MIPILAWRNTWRNPTRSWVVIIAIAMGIWAAMFMTGFATGMSRSYIENAIQGLLSHIQIHQPEYLQDRSVKSRIPDLAVLQERLEYEENIANYSIRTLATGMIASGNATRGVTIRGVEPEMEKQVSNIATKLQEGDYFESDRKNQLLISRKMAEKLKAKLRSKLVLTFQDMEGTITAGAFRVVGIFESGNAPFDEGNVFVKRQDLNRLLTEATADPIPSGELAHEVAIMLRYPETLETTESIFEKAFPKLQTDTYREAAPDLQLYESQIENVSMIYLTIIMLALVFGIINTMLMAVLERVKELGMLMAIGMNKLKVFLMIVVETLLLGLIGAPLGVLLGSLTISYLGKNGLDLSSFSQSLQMYGLSEQVYFDLEPSVYVQIPVAIFITALMAAIYPAFKAIRLRPVEAIRKI